MGEPLAQDQQYVTFGIDREVFAIPVDSVQEILDLRPISRLPEAPAYVLGLMEIRGAGVPIVDLRRKLGLGPVTPTERTRIIVSESSSVQRPTIGLVTDCVFEVTDLGGNALQPPPTVGPRWRSEAIQGVGRRGDDFVMVLDLERLLQDGEPLAA